MEIWVDRLCFGYPGRPVIEDLDAHFASGRLSGIIGPNGSGKTTLIRLMSGAIKPVSGQVLLDKQPVGELKGRALARKIAVCPRNPIWALIFRCWTWCSWAASPISAVFPGKRQGIWRWPGGHAHDRGGTFGKAFGHRPQRGRVAAGYHRQSPLSGVAGDADGRAHFQFGYPPSVGGAGPGQAAGP